jgi:hypothetical protein
MDYGKQCDFIFFDKQKILMIKNTLDFSNSKARFITKSPRDKNWPKDVLKSEIFWMARIEIFKI